MEIYWNLTVVLLYVIMYLCIDADWTPGPALLSLYVNIFDFLFYIIG
jgi:hypothetical protein